MAINTNAVSSNSVAPVIPAREPALPLNAQREQTLATPPSAITRISSEGRLRAEFERRQIVASSQANLVEAAPQPSAALTAPPVPKPSGQTRTVVALASPQPNERTSAAPQPATLVESRDDTLELPAFVPQRATPNETPAGLQATRVSSAPAARFLSASATLENIANASAPTTDDRIYQLKISQTASEFIAAFNEFQNKRNQNLDKLAPVNQAQVSNVAELRAGPVLNTPRPAVDVTRLVETGAARFDLSTFAVGVARLSAAPGNSNATEAAASPENNNDTRRILRAEVAGQLNQVPQFSRAEVLPEALNTAQYRPGLTSQPPQSAAQNSAASSLGGTGVGQGGLAKHLNALANLLTP